MSDAVLVAIIVAIPPTLVALINFWQGRKNSIKQQEIHVLVNSNMATLKMELTAAKEKIVSLERLIKDINV